MPVNINVIGKNLKRLREDYKFNQGSVSKFLGISGGLLCKIESGGRPINPEQLEKLAVLYGCNVSDLTDGNPINKSIKSTISKKLSENDLETLYNIKRKVCGVSTYEG